MAQDIKLPAPDQHRKTLSMSETLAGRHSTREFSKKNLSVKDLSDICWAGFGINREDGRRTAPTALNKQEIRLFVFMAKGTYEYIAKDNLLKLMAKGDSRGLVAGTSAFSQDWVKDAPVSLVMVMDMDIMGSTEQRSLMMACVDAGNVSENINLFCQSIGMVTVPRATMDSEAIRKLLGLSDNQIPIMNNPVGYPVK